MKKCKWISLIVLASVFASPAVYAAKYVGDKGTVTTPSGKTAAGCLRAAAGTDLDLNNVRALIYTGGDMWWDHSGAARYEVPKDSKKMSLFAGALWLGGTDVNNQLRVAALRFRQVGDDYWPGPLNVTTAEIDANTCAKYDRHFKANRTDVEEFVAHPSYPNVPRSEIPKEMLEWPAHGDVSLGQDYHLAPFFDYDGDDYYNPEAGDYPAYDLSGQRVCSFNSCNLGLYGDETLWWVFNDKGNIHTETKAAAIGMEIRAQAFAFSTNDEINNMTFYNYQLINRSTFTLQETYFGQWVDADLGYAWDDYVGCDVSRGLGYCYNGTSIDGSGQIEAYGTNPPAVGVDFFEGPYMDANGLDDPKTKFRDPSINGLNFGDGIVDNERWGMRRFVYHSNNTGIQGDPQTGSDYYNYLRGIWRDGTKMLYGGNGHTSSGATGPECEFMFPGDTDPTDWGTNGVPPNPKYWTEQTANNPPSDRRFAQSAGPFTLTPGACNNITVGVVWARALSSDPFQSVELVRKADDKAQALFENCFKVLNGPDAPDLVIRELNRELIFTLVNPASSNNATETYEEIDPLITDSAAIADKKNTYKFQGYQIFQLKDASVSLGNDRYDPNKVRLVAQCDIKDGVGQLVNFYKDQALNANIPREEVNGADKGIVHSFRITDDLFATGDPKLVNHKQYFFTVIAYGYNQYEKYDPFDPLRLNGQQKPYFPGRRRIKTYSAIPHSPTPENGGQILNAAYGSGVQLTRVEGQGNGGNVLDLTPASLNQLLASADQKITNPTYLAGKGPVNIRVIDPVKVPKADFTISLNGISDTSKWTLTNNTSGESVTAVQPIGVLNEQIIPKWGLSITVQQVKDPGNVGVTNNGLLESSISYSDPNKFWFIGVPDIDGASPFNWIRSGKVVTGGTATCEQKMWDDYQGEDDEQVFEKVVNGWFAPYRLCGYHICKNSTTGINTYSHGPAWEKFINLNQLDSVASIDLVITRDKSKWTRSAVLETGEDPILNEGGARKMDLRTGASVDKEGNSDGSGVGMGWFPGYAINVETGERLNIAYGEDSWMTGDNGRDMQWNPTSTFYDNLGSVRLGGKHYIYIFRNGTGVAADTFSTRYDSCKVVARNVGGTAPTDINKRFIYRNVMWVGMPMLAPDQQLLSCDVSIRIRVGKPYRTYKTSATPVNNNSPMYTFNTHSLAATTNDAATAKNALDMINVVPNPYYAYSAYEKDQLSNTIKIVNLPAKCTISIFTVNGTLVRRFKRDVNKDVSEGATTEEVNLETAQEWDLKNSKGVPIASGLYIIHVDADGIGEKVVKWFGVLRPTDLNSY